MALQIRSRLLKLNLGCGCDLRPGYLNVDKFPASSEVMQADFPILPFADQSAEEVVLSHVLEHFGYGDALILTTEMARVLTLGGKAVIEVPDIEWCLRKFLESPEPPAYTNPSYDYNTEHRWGLYAQSIWGDQHNDGLFHKWGYTEARLSGLLKHAGLSSVRVEKLFSHGVQCLSAVATK